MNREDLAKTIDLAIVAAVPSELESLIAHRGEQPAANLFGMPVWQQAWGKRSLLLAAGGIGKANAAAATAWMIERFEVGMVWHLGSAGAYVGGPLKIGDVLLTDRVLCGDEGVLTRKGILSSREIGIPLLFRDGEAVFDSMSVTGLPLFEQLIRTTPPGVYWFPEKGLTPRRLDDPEAGRNGSPDESLPGNRNGFFRLAVGPGVTVGMASGDADVARRRFERYAAWAEDMEASAVVQTCMRARVPVVECRAVSNIAGDRDKRNWRLREAMSHCHALIRIWLEALRV